MLLRLGSSLQFCLSLAECWGYRPTPPHLVHCFCTPKHYSEIQSLLIKTKESNLLMQDHGPRLFQLEITTVFAVEKSLNTQGMPESPGLGMDKISCTVALASRWSLDQTNWGLGSRLPGRNPTAAFCLWAARGRGPLTSFRVDPVHSWGQLPAAACPCTPRSSPMTPKVSPGDAPLHRSRRL